MLHGKDPSSPTASELGLINRGRWRYGDILYAAYTGKAALVMTRKAAASTIHSLINRVSAHRARNRTAARRNRAHPRVSFHAYGR
jgi:hypothetical protein